MDKVDFIFFCFRKNLATANVSPHASIVYPFICTVCIYFLLKKVSLKYFCHSSTMEPKYVYDGIWKDKVS